MQGQLCVQRADLLTVTECCDRDRAIHIAELRNFEKRKRRDRFSGGKLKSVGNQCIILVAANLDLVGVRFAVVDELSLYGLFSDQSL